MKVYVVTSEWNVDGERDYVVNGTFASMNGASNLFNKIKDEIKEFMSRNCDEEDITCENDDDKYFFLIDYATGDWWADVSITEMELED